MTSQHLWRLHHITDVLPYFPFEYMAYGQNMESAGQSSGTFPPGSQTHAHLSTQAISHTHHAQSGLHTLLETSSLAPSKGKSSVLCFEEGVGAGVRLRQCSVFVGIPRTPQKTKPPLKRETGGRLK